MSASPVRICLFGGSFDPPHVCHVLASAWAISVLPIDELWWVPVNAHAFGKALQGFDDRFAMCEAAIASLDSERVRVSDLERELGGESRTLRTVEALRSRRPDAEVSLLIGADLLDELPRWMGWERLREQVTLHVIGRRSPRRNEERGLAWELALPDVSSTELRELLRTGPESRLEALLPAAVHRMIREKGWYA